MVSACVYSGWHVGAMGGAVWHQLCLPHALAGTPQPQGSSQSKSLSGYMGVSAKRRKDGDEPCAMLEPRETRSHEGGGDSTREF